MRRLSPRSPLQSDPYTRRKAAGWLLGGLVSLGVSIGLFFWLPFYYQSRESTYLRPTANNQPGIKIRRDRLGNGDFGAPRSNHRVHRGIDIAAKVGERVIAAKSGRVLHADPKGGYGNLIHLAHPDGLQSSYAHLSEIFVQKGKWVLQGQTIGRVGKSGNARFRHIHPHLHFEIRQKETPLDPMPYMRLS